MTLSRQHIAINAVGVDYKPATDLLPTKNLRCVVKACSTALALVMDTDERLLQYLDLHADDGGREGQLRMIFAKTNKSVRGKSLTRTTHEQTCESRRTSTACCCGTPCQAAVRVVRLDGKRHQRSFLQ